MTGPDTSLREKALRDEHERIWLEPDPGDDPEGRMWCQDNVWGHGAVEYVRADIAEAKDRRIEALEAALRPFAQTALVIRTTERATGQQFADGDAFKSGMAWQKDGVAQTITYGHFRDARAALSGKEGQS